MARKLKTYQTSMGFFDLAVAAPSMKAALEAWGSKNNLFHQGFAHEADDIDVVSATMAKPGVVLRRPVGSKKAFSEHSSLPLTLPKTSAARTASTAINRRRGFDDKATRAAAKEYEREERRRDQQRAKEKAKRAERDKAVAGIEAERAKAKSAHDRRIEKLETARADIEERISAENLDWDAQLTKFKRAIDRIRK